MKYCIVYYETFNTNMYSRVRQRVKFFANLDALRAEYIRLKKDQSNKDFSFFKLAEVQI